MQDGDASIEARLRASRARLLLNADAERRAIERVLHDSIQQELVAISVKLQLARRLAHSEQTAAQDLLDEIEQEVRDALDGVRAVSDAIYPSVLAVRGLAEAVRGAAAASGVGVRIEANQLVRYPPELEGAVYFCCREALKVAAALGERPIDRGVVLPFRHLAQDVALSWRQLCERRLLWTRPLRDERLDDLRVDHRPPGSDRLDRADELVEIVDALLEQVGPPFRADVE